MDQVAEQDRAGKLVIRVKIDSTLEPPSAQLESESGLIGRILVVCLLVALAVSGFYLFSTQENEPPNSISTHKAMSENTQDKKLSNAVVSSDRAVAINLNIDSEPVEKSAVPPDEIIEASGNEAQVMDAVVNEQPSSEIQEVLTAAEPKVESPPEVEPQIEPETISAPVISEVLPANIKRAQFTNDIKQREPIDLVQGHVAAKHEGLRRIYFFTELVNLKGHTIRHQWFHNGKLRSELKFNVRGNRWRVNSSKRLNPAAVGTWTVKVIDEQEEVLLERSFEYSF